MGKDKHWIFLIVVVVGLISFIHQLFFTAQRVLAGSNLIWLLAFVFLSALLAAYGDTFLRRLVKVSSSGLELIPEEKLIKVLATPLPPKENPMRELEGRESLTPEEKDHYQQINDFILVVAARGLEPQEMDKRLRRDYEQVLLYAGRYAVLNGEYLRAIRLLTLLREIAGDSAEVRSNLADAYIWASDDLKEKEKREEFIRIAIEHYENAVALRKAPLDHLDYYQLGWAYDELNLFDKAIENYLNVLKIKESYFDAIYNIAASFVKWGNFLETKKYRLNEVKIKFDDAITWLEKIPPHAPTWEGINDDRDFDPLRTHPEYATRFNALCSMVTTSSSSSYNIQ